LLHFYFRVQVPLKYPYEILFLLSREIFKTVIIYKAILSNYNILVLKEEKESKKKMDIFPYLYITSMTGSYYSMGPDGSMS
jgi:tRNA1(Val) A37 N6-methylase TrmN6